MNLEKPKSLYYLSLGILAAMTYGTLSLSSLEARTSRNKTHEVNEHQKDALKELTGRPGEVRSPHEARTPPHTQDRLPRAHEARAGEELLMQETHAPAIENRGEQVCRPGSTVQSTLGSLEALLGVAVTQNISEAQFWGGVHSLLKTGVAKLAESANQNIRRGAEILAQATKRAADVVAATYGKFDSNIREHLRLWKSKTAEFVNELSAGTLGEQAVESCLK